MTTRAPSLLLAIVVASVSLQPYVLADDKKKKLTPYEQQQQWKLQQMQQQAAADAAAAAAAAAAAKKRAQKVAAAPQPQNETVMVHIYNHTRGPVQCVEVSPDGNTLKNLGNIAPYGPPDNEADHKQVRPGTNLAFVANGQVLTRYTTDTGFQQEVHIRAAAGAQRPPVANVPLQQPINIPPRQIANVPIQPAAPAGDGYVQVLVTNRTGVPLLPIRYLPDGSAKNFDVIQPGGPYTMRTRPGMIWTFSAGEQVIEGYVVEQAPVQQLVIGVGAPAAAPVAQPRNPVANNGLTPNNPQVQAWNALMDELQQELPLARSDLASGKWRPLEHIYSLADQP